MIWLGWVLTLASVAMAVWACVLGSWRAGAFCTTVAVVNLSCLVTWWRERQAEQAAARARAARLQAVRDDGQAGVQ